MAGKSVKEIIAQTLLDIDVEEKDGANIVASQIITDLGTAGFAILPAAEPGTERVPHASEQD